MATVRVQREDFDAGVEAAALARGRRDVGAVVSFVGYCRDEGGRLAALELEHYPGMAEAEMARVVRQAEARWPLIGVTAIHRVGKIAPGEQIVFVAAAAAQYSDKEFDKQPMMDFLKTRAPFWKRAIRADGVIEGWVEARGADDSAAARWSADG